MSEEGRTRGEEEGKRWKGVRAGEKWKSGIGQAWIKYSLPYHGAHIMYNKISRSFDDKKALKVVTPSNQPQVKYAKQEIVEIKNLPAAIGPIPPAQLSNIFPFFADLHVNECVRQTRKLDPPHPREGQKVGGGGRLPGGRRCLTT